jgi:hypothetical protein
MSTNLKTLKGTFENSQTNETSETDLNVTRFSGGNEGPKLLLSIRTQNDFFTHVALSKNEVITLIEELKENFDL